MSEKPVDWEKKLYRKPIPGGKTIGEMAKEFEEIQKREDEVWSNAEKVRDRMLNSDFLTKKLIDTLKGGK